jgi:hypothetical protein
MGDRSPPVARSVPLPVRAAFGLLVSAPLWGMVLTCYATWALNSIPAGTGALAASLNRQDRHLFEGSWVLDPGRPITATGNLPSLIWLGLAYLAFLPLAYYVSRGYRQARLLTYLFGAAMLGLTTVAMIADENFVDPDPGLLSPDAYQAWQDLFPPGYPAIHDFTLVALLASVLVACLLLDRPAARTYFARR